LPAIHIGIDRRGPVIGLALTIGLLLLPVGLALTVRRILAVGLALTVGILLRRVEEILRRTIRPAAGSRCFDFGGARRDLPDGAWV